MSMVSLLWGLRGRFGICLIPSPARLRHAVESLSIAGLPAINVKMSRFSKFPTAKNVSLMRHQHRFRPDALHIVSRTKSSRRRAFSSFMRETISLYFWARSPPRSMISLRYYHRRFDILYAARFRAQIRFRTSSLNDTDISNAGAIREASAFLGT